MEQINIFLKGITSDIDAIHQKTDAWVFPTRNVRIMNKDGRGFIITSQKGNEVFFSVNTGYAVVAVEEFRDILYFVSTDGVNTEIGCYPRPVAFTDPGSGFVDEYHALINFTGNVFNSPLFGYTKESAVKLIIDNAYDDSANLYLCDGVNSDKIVNSGFTVSGDLNDIFYTEEDFLGKLNHILYSLNPPVVDSMKVVPGGKLAPGNYHVFIAYKTSTYDKTEYLSEYYPISVFAGHDIVSVHGLPDKAYDQSSNYVNKRIELKLKNVDSRFKFISVGLMRFFGSGAPLAEREEIEIATDTLIPANGIVDLVITGEESHTILTSGELYKRYLLERISKDQIFFNKRIYKGNLKQAYYDKSSYSALAQLITASSFSDDIVTTPSFGDIVDGGYVDLLHYQDESSIYDKLSYFDGEIYPYAVSFLLSNGVVTEAYPIEGSDELNGSVTNDKGLFLFARYPLKSIIGIEFDLSSIKGAVANDHPEIVGMYLMRGERLVNALYEGVMERTAKGVEFRADRKHTIDTRDCNSPGQCNVEYSAQMVKWFASEDGETAYNIPVFKFQHDSDAGIDSGPAYDVNRYQFPIAVSNINNEGTGSLITKEGKTKYEYPIAVPYPAIPHTPGGGDVDDKDVWPDGESSIVEELWLSDDHFALFSPDFMTEIEHLTNNEGDYFLEIVKSVKGQSYTNATEEYAPNGIYSGMRRPHRIRVSEFDTETNFTFTTLLDQFLEILLNGATSPVDVTRYTKCPGMTITVPDWNINGVYFDQTGGSNVIHVAVATIPSTLVYYASKYWICIQDNGEVGDAEIPVAGSLYWTEVSIDDIYSREWSSHEFPGSVLHGSYYEKKSCSSHTYPLADPGTTVEGNVYPVKAFNIEKGTYKGRGRFSSYVEDGQKYRNKGKKGFYSHDGRITHIQHTGGGGWEETYVLTHYNRSYQTPAYIGLLYKGLPREKNYTYICRLYKSDPRIYSVNDHYSSFSPEFTSYWNISDLIKAEDSKKIYKGDNFKTKHWWRMSHHVDFDDNPSSGHESKGFEAWYSGYTSIIPEEQDGKYFKSAYFLDEHYMHGILYGFVSSNRRNVALRSIYSVLDADNLLSEYKFFPYTHTFGTALSWIYDTSAKEDLVESLLINEGYNNVKGFVIRLGYDKNLPLLSLVKDSRIAMSDIGISKSFVNGLRNFYLLNFVDFETEHGPIIRLIENYGILISVRENAIVRHYGTGDKTSSSIEKDILSLSTLPLAYYGLQDWHAIVKTRNSIYGIDYRKGLLWSIQIATTDYGIRKAGSQIVSKVLGVEKAFTDLLSKLSTERTSPVVMNGMSIGYNSSYGEVYFSFFNKDYKETLMFSEDLTFFLGNSDVSSPMYVNFKKSMISIGNTEDTVHTVYLNDADQDVTKFYGNESLNSLSIIINGNTEKENSIVLTKIFESLKISTPHMAFEKIVYETELQKSEYIFREDSSQFWKDSEWIEGEWNVPIIMDSEDDDPYYEEGSMMRGKAMKITLYFKYGKSFYISNIISTFKNSFN